MDAATIEPAVQLSKTFQSSVLMAPGHLDRITTDCFNYQHYLKKQAASSVDGGAFRRNLRTVKKMGDKFFFIQKDFPVEQNYSLNNRLSNTRPSDQLVDRPLITDRVRSKQVNLPYPQEHPYTSHIPRYNHFPNPTHHPPSHLSHSPFTHHSQQPATQPSQPPQLTITTESPDNTSEYHHHQDIDQTDTAQHYKQPETLPVDHLPCTPRRPYYVDQKAADYGLRLETVVPVDQVVTMPEVEHVLWQFPKDFPHKRSVIYPTSSHLFSCPPKNQLPSTYKSPSHMQRTMAAFNKATYGTSSYSDHYSSTCMPCIDRPHQSKESMRPYVSENYRKHYYADRVLSTSTSPSAVGKHELVGFSPLSREEMEETDDKEQDVKSEISQAIPEVRNDNVCTSDLKLKVAENEGEMAEQGGLAIGGVSADSTIPGHNLPEIQKMTSGLNLADPLNTPPLMMTSTNRIKAKADMFPLIEQKPRLPTITTADLIIPPRVPPTVSAPYAKLDPFYYCSPRGPPRSALTGVKNKHVHTLNRGVVSTRSHEKLNRAEVVRHFTSNFQKPFSSPDMRTVMAKKGKRHEFFGHHAYDFR